MANKNDDRHSPIRCSFCGKSQGQVRKLISGPGDVYICDECVELCAEIVDEDFEEEAARAGGSDINLLKPAEIKEFLDQYVIGQKKTRM